MDQLDKYVANFDPEGTSYIRCPRCTNTIQGINRYDSLNKARSFKRENRKHQLEQLSNVSEETIENLRFSLDVVNSFCPFDLDHYRKHIDKTIRKSHADALRLLSRYAFILYVIHEIHKEFNAEMPFNAEKWKESMKSCQTGITHQYEEEMTMELHRLLIIERVVSFKKLMENSEIEMSDCVKDQFKFLLKRDLSQKLTLQVKKECEIFLDDIYKSLMSSDKVNEFKINIESLVSKSSIAKRILSKPNHMELYEILEGENILPTP